MRAVRQAGALALIAGLLSLVTGHASLLSSAAKTLANNGATVSRCDTDGISIVQNLSGGNVVSVTVGQIAAACGGGTIWATVDNHTTSRTGSSTIPSGGGSTTVTLSSAVAPAASEQVDVALMGP